MFDFMEFANNCSLQSEETLNEKFYQKSNELDSLEFTKQVNTLTQHQYRRTKAFVFQTLLASCLLIFSKLAANCNYLNRPSIRKLVE